MEVIMKIYSEEMESSDLFDPDVLLSFDRSDMILPPHLKLRPLKITDNKLGFLELLAQLTKVGDIDDEMFKQRFDNMKKTKCYYVMVVSDQNQEDKIIGTATLILEQKFIRMCAIKGRVEEVVVDESTRGTGLGRILVTTCTRLSEKLGVYKTTLECAPHNEKFYEKVGYSDGGETYMQLRF